MSACGSSHTGASGGETARRMRAITAGLSDAGLVACLNDTGGVLDITATLDRPGGKASEVIVDEDGYVEVRYWNHPGTTPEHITAVIVRALAAIAAAQRASFLPGRTASAKDGLDL
jgi:hypothetical protein